MRNRWHLLLTIVTAGCWLPVWVLCWVSRHRPDTFNLRLRRRVLQLEEEERRRRLGL